MNDENRIQRHIQRKIPHLRLELDSDNTTEDACRDGLGTAAAATRAELFGRRASSFCAMKDYDRAVADYLEVLKIDAQADYAMVGLADCYHWQRDFVKAADFYTRAIAVNPINAHAYAWRGSAHCALGQLERALSDYNEAIRLAPEYATYYSARANVYSHLGKHDLAMQDHDRAFRLAEGTTAES